MLSPQDFARLLQEKLIDSGEHRPLEFSADLFALLPTSGSHSGLMPLDSYYRFYLAAHNDAERQRVIRSFLHDWKWYSQAVVAAGNRAQATGTAPVKIPPPACQPPSSVPSIKFIVRSAIALASIVGLTLICMCCLPNIMGIILFNVAPGMFPNVPINGPPPGALVTEFAGGRGGGLHYSFDRNGRPAIGLAYTVDNHAGQSVLGTLEALFDDQPVRRHHFGNVMQVVRAKEGYVVGGLEVDAEEFVNAVRVTFVKRTEQGLDLSDTYQSEWLGTPTAGREPRKLAGAGEEVVGVAAHQGLILDSVALLYKPRRPPALGPIPPPAAGAPENPLLNPEP